VVDDAYRLVINKKTFCFAALYCASKNALRAARVFAFFISAGIVVLPRGGCIW